MVIANEVSYAAYQRLRKECGFHLEHGLIEAVWDNMEFESQLSSIVQYEKILVQHNEHAAKEKAALDIEAARYDREWGTF